MYFRLGKHISENARYGNQFIHMLSISLRLDFPDVTGFSERNLWRMKAFYEQYKDFSILPLSVAELPYIPKEILEKLPTKDDINLHLDICA